MSWDDKEVGGEADGALFERYILSGHDHGVIHTAKVLLWKVVRSHRVVKPRVVQVARNEARFVANRSR